MAHHHHVHSSRWAWTVSLVLQLTIMVVEFVAGRWTKSVSLMADAWHMFSDVGSGTLGWWAHRKAHQPADDQATYGHQKYEDVSAVVHGTVLVMAGLYAVIETAAAWYEPHRRILYGPAMAVAWWGLIANVIGFLLMHRFRDQHLNVRAYWQHLISDALSSVVVLVSLMFGAASGRPWIEAIGGAVIASYLLRSGYGVLSDGRLWNRLTEQVEAGVRKKLERVVAETPGVLAVHHTHVSYDNGRGYRFSAVAHIDGRLDGYEQLPILRRIEQRLALAGVTHATIVLTPLDGSPPLVQISEEVEPCPPTL